MRYDQITISVLLTVLLVGCATPGDEENYKPLDSDQRDLYQSPDTRFDARSNEQPIRVIHLVDAGDAVDTGEGVSFVVARSDSTDMMQDQVQELADVLDSEPSVSSDNILDRRGWSRLTVGPADGSTIHNPIYWRDCPIDSSHCDLRALPSVEARLEAAMARPDAGNWSLDNVLISFVEPGKFVADGALLPWSMIQAHPLEEVTTPAFHP